MKFWIQVAEAWQHNWIDAMGARYGSRRRVLKKVRIELACCWHAGVTPSRSCALRPRNLRLRRTF